MEKTDGIVFRTPREAAPSGAMRITRFEAGMMQWHVVKDWKPFSDVWPIRFGHVIAGSLSAVSSLIICNYYRRKFKLGTYGRFTIQIPAVFTPCLISSVLHFRFVVLPVLLQDECPICIQLRNAAVQVASSIILPLIVSPIACFVYASRFGSERLPSFSWKNRNEIFKIYLNTSKRLKNPLAFLIAGNALAATYVTYMQGTKYFKMQMKMVESLTVQGTQGTNQETLPLKQ